MFPVFKRCMCGIALKVKPPITVFGLEGRYVSALYSAGHQQQELKQIEEALKKLQKELKKPKMVDFIETSLLSRAEKVKLLADFSPAAGFPKTLTNFLVAVAENGRLKQLPRMVRLFLQVMVAHRKEALCEVITARALDDTTRAALVAALKKLAKGRNITLTETVDPSILGGIIVGVEDKHMDLSIARKINMYSNILKQAI